MSFWQLLKQIQEEDNEENISAEQPFKKKDSRVQSPDGDKGWKKSN